MASASIVPSVSEMVELRANGLGIPTIFPIHSNGFASVSSVHLSMRFSFQGNSICVERKIYDTATSLLSMTLRESPRVAENGSSMWELCAGKYRVYGLPVSSTNVSTEFRTPPYSSVFTFNTPPLVKVKIRPSLHTVIHLSNSLNGDEHPVSTPIPIPILFLHPLLNPPIPFSNAYVLFLPCLVVKTYSRNLIMTPC